MDRNSLRIVVDIFRYMRDNEGVVDYYKPSVPYPEDLVNILQVLENNLERARDSTVEFFIEKTELLKLCSFLYVASDIAMDHNVGRFLADLYQTFDDWDESGFKDQLNVISPKYT